jgi:hypothetical protein
MLPNVARQEIEESHFEQFFTKVVNKTYDTALNQFMLSKTGFSTLSQRKKSIFFASLLQFDTSVKRRINSLTQAIMNSTNTGRLIPNTFLFAPDQSAYSFKLFVQNILPMLNEDILVEFLLIIQNQKNTLLQSVGPILDMRYAPSHLTRTMFAAQIRKTKAQLSQVIRIPSAMTSPRSTIGSPTTVPVVSTTTMGPPTIVRRRQTTPSSRKKRSWGGFWGSAFALATQEDMDKVLKHELDLADNESKLSQALFNITITNSQLIGALKSVTAGVTKLVGEEKNIFSQIDAIMHTEEKYIEQLNELIDSVDKSTTLIADYQMIQLQISLLVHTTDKMKALVSSVLTHTLDTTLIPLEVFKPHLRDNLKTTMRLVTYRLRYTTKGIILNVKIPVLSNPYQIYGFRTVSFMNPRDNTWFKIKNPPNIAVNAINELIDLEPILTTCIHIYNDYVCRAQDVRIYKIDGLLTSDGQFPKYTVTSDPKASRNPPLCAVRVLRATQGPTPVSLSPCDLEILHGIIQQEYLIKSPILTLSSPNSDVLISECKEKSDNHEQEIKIGTNFLAIKKGCHYETSQVVIHTTQEITISEKIEDLDDIDTVHALSDLDMFLQQEFPIVGNMSKLREQLKKYNSSVTANRATVEDLSKTLSTIDRIHQISEFDPTTINFEQPMATANWITAMFWIMSLVLISVVAYFSFKRCPTKCTNCLAVPLIILKHLGCLCVQLVQDAAAASYGTAPQQDIEMQNNTNRRNNDPDAQSGSATAPLMGSGGQDSTTVQNVLQNYSYKETMFLTHNPTPIQWSVQLSAYEAYSIQAAMNTSETDTIRIRFNTISSRVTDMDNNVLDYVPGPQTLILDKYQAILKNAAPTPTFIDDEGVIRNKKYMGITFNPITKTWYNTNTNQTVTGLPNPSQYSKDICY